MQGTCSFRKGYALAAGLGAIGGGLVVALATRAIPKVMARVMSEMMKGMMAQVGEGDHSPVEV